MRNDPRQYECRLTVEVFHQQILDLLHIWIERFPVNCGIFADSIEELEISSCGGRWQLLRWCVPVVNASVGKDAPAVEER